MKTKTVYISNDNVEWPTEKAALLRDAAIEVAKELETKTDVILRIDEFVSLVEYLNNKYNFLLP